MPTALPPISASSFLISPTFMRMLRFFRIARLLKLIRVNPGIKRLLATVVVSAPSLANASLMFNSVGFTQLSKVLTTPSIAFIERARGHGHPLDVSFVMGARTGIYLIDADGTPVRLGFAIGNEFSDHITERGNYLWLAHSKLRQASLGPELLVGTPPEHIEGSSRILRDGDVIWEKPFLSGEGNMSHSFANLEHHHFKYDLFRRPGDVHVHFFGTATLSFSDGIATQEGDVFEIAAAPFTLPVRNALKRAEPVEVTVQAL